MRRKSIIQRLSVYAGLIFVILTSGCAATRMYKGEELPKQEIAVINGGYKYYFFHSVTVYVCSVDEELVKPPSKKVEVMPGFHKVVIAALGRESGGLHNFHGLFAQVFSYYCPLEFTAEAGHQYKIKLPFWWLKGSPIKIIDTKSGEVVASQPIKWNIYP